MAAFWKQHNNYFCFKITNINILYFFAQNIVSEWNRTFSQIKLCLYTKNCIQNSMPAFFKQHNNDFWFKKMNLIIL